MPRPARCKRKGNLMIYCAKQALERYRGLHPNLDRAIDELAIRNLAQLPMGQTAVDEDRVFFNRFDYITGDCAQALFETHLRYADIHLLLSGEEEIAVAHAQAHMEAERDETRDYIGTRGERECNCVMQPHKALIVFPGEAHRSGQMRGEPCAVQKVVCKVLMD